MKSLKISKDVLSSIYHNLISHGYNITGIEYGYKEINNQLTNQLCYIARVNKKKSYWEIFLDKKTKMIPKTIDGVLTDVQEGEIKTRSCISPIAEKTTPFIYNVNKNWYGSVGAIVKGVIHSPTTYAIVNRHVAGSIGDVFSMNGLPYGVVTHIASDADQLDCALIELHPSMSISSPTTVNLNVFPSSAQINDSVWINRGFSTPQLAKGNVIAIGLAQVNDSILGPFLTRYFRVRSNNGQPLSAPGDSGSPVYTDEYGCNKHCGIVFGSVTNDTGCVFTEDILDAFPIIWGELPQVQNYNPNPPAPGNYEWSEVSFMLAKNMSNSIELLPESVKTWLKNTTQV